MGFDYMRRQDPASWDRTPMPAEKPPFKALFLLHGISGNHTDFMSETRIRTFAEERGLAVIMPSGYNAFYLDHPETHNYYGRYVGLELVEAARRMFPISRRREDTFIGGISMGAYGALRNGFKYAENFGGIIALSSAMILGDFDRLINDDVFFLSRNFLESTFGDLAQVIDSDKDPRRLAADVVYCDRPRPRVFMHGGRMTRSPNPTARSPSACEAPASKLSSARCPVATTGPSGTPRCPRRSTGCLVRLDARTKGD